MSKAGFARILKRHRPWLLLLALVWALPVGAGAAEFSAQMLLKDGPKTMPGKIYIKDGKMRQEFLDEEGQTITIVRQDKKVIWVILPQDKAYVEMPYKGRMPGQFLQMPPEALQKRRVGTEVVNGYLADKFEVTVRGGPGRLTKQTIWVAQKLGTPVKMVCRDGNFCLEYRRIKEGRVAERLFELPPGYTKVNTTKF